VQEQVKIAQHAYGGCQQLSEYKKEWQCSGNAADTQKIAAS